MTKRMSRKRAAYNLFLAVFVVIALISMGILIGYGVAMNRADVQYYGTCPDCPTCPPPLEGITLPVNATWTPSHTCSHVASETVDYLEGQGIYARRMTVTTNKVHTSELYNRTWPIGSLHAVVYAEFPVDAGRVMTWEDFYEEYTPQGDNLPCVAWGYRGD